MKKISDVFMSVGIGFFFSSLYIGFGYIGHKVQMIEIKKKL